MAIELDVRASTTNTERLKTSLENVKTAAVEANAELGKLKEGSGGKLGGDWAAMRKELNEFRSMLNPLKSQLDGAITGINSMTSSNQSLSKSLGAVAVGLGKVSTGLDKQTTALQATASAQKAVSASSRDLASVESRRAKYIEMTLTAQQRQNRLTKELNTLFKDTAADQRVVARAQELLRDSLAASGTAAEKYLYTLKRQNEEMLKTPAQLAAMRAGWSTLSTAQQNATLNQQLLNDSLKVLVKYAEEPVPKLQALRNELAHLNSIQALIAKGGKGMSGIGLDEGQLQRAITSVNGLVAAEEKRLAMERISNSVRKTSIDSTQQMISVRQKSTESFKAEVAALEKSTSLFPRAAKAVEQYKSALVSPAERQHLESLRELSNDMQLLGRHYQKTVPIIEQYRSAIEAAARANQAFISSNGQRGIDGGQLKDATTHLEGLIAAEERRIAQEQISNSIRKESVTSTHELMTTRQKATDGLRAEIAALEQSTNAFPRNTAAINKNDSSLKFLTETEQKHLRTLRQLNTDMSSVEKYYKKAIDPVDRYRRAIEAAARANAQFAASNGARGISGAGFAQVQRGALTELLKSKPQVEAMNKGLLSLVGGFNLTTQAAAASRAAMIGAGQSFGIFTGSTLAVAAAVYTMAAAIRSSISVGIEFEYAMTRIGVMMSSTQDIMFGFGESSQTAFKAVRDEILALAESTQFNALEVAEGAQILSRSGKDAQFIFANLGAVLDLAAVGMVDMATAADIATGVMASFNLQGQGFVEAVDILAVTSVKTKATIDDMGQSISYIGPIAHQAGLEFYEVAAAIGTLADVNIRGSRAGTSLRRIITNLLSPTKAAQKAFDDLGINIKEMTKDGVNLEEVFSALAKSGASIAQLKAIFGQYAISAAAALTDSTAKLKAFGDEFSNVRGYSARMRDELRKNLKMEIEELTSVFQTLQVTAYDTFGPGLREHIRNLTTYIRDNLESLASTIASVVNSFTWLVKTVVEHGSLLLTLVKYYALLKASVTIVNLLGSAWLFLGKIHKAYLVTSRALSIASIAQARELAAVGASATGASAGMMKLSAAATVLWRAMGGWAGVAVTALVSLGAWAIGAKTAADATVNFSDALDTVAFAGETLKDLPVDRLELLQKSLTVDMAKAPLVIASATEEISRLDKQLEKLDNLKIWDRKSESYIPLDVTNTEKYLDLMDRRLKAEGQIIEAKEVQGRGAEAQARIEIASTVAVAKAQREVFSQYVKFRDDLFINNPKVLAVLDSWEASIQAFASRLEGIPGIIGDVFQNLSVMSLGKFAELSKAAGDLASEIQSALVSPASEDTEDYYAWTVTLSSLIKRLEEDAPRAQAAASILSSSLEDLRAQLGRALELGRAKLPEGFVPGGGGSGIPKVDAKAERELQKAASALQKYFEEYEKGQGSAEGVVRELKEVRDWIAQVESGTPAATKALADMGFTVEEAKKALAYAEEQTIFDYVETSLAAVDPRFKDLVKTMTMVTSTTLTTDAAMAMLTESLSAKGIVLAPEIWERIRAGIEATTDGSANLRIQWAELVKQSATIQAGLGGEVTFEGRVKEFAGAGAEGGDEERIRSTLALVEANALFGESLRAVREEEELMAETQIILQQLMEDKRVTEEEAIKLSKLRKASLPIGELEHEARLLRARIGLGAQNARQQYILNAAVAAGGANFEAQIPKIRDAAGAAYDLEHAWSMVQKTMGESNPIFDLSDAIGTLEEELANLRETFEKLPEGIEKAEIGEKIKQTELAVEQLGAAMQIEVIEGYKGMLEAGKAFFKEGSKGYKIMEGAVAALSVAQDLIAMKAAVISVLEQGKGDPYSAWARMAAMAAAVAPFLASIGVTLSSFGGSGSGAGSGPPARQATQGTGTILGDSEAKSESGLNALEITAESTSALVGINRGMLRALTNMRDGISGATSMLARSAGDVDFGEFDPGTMLNGRNGAAMGAVIGSIIPVIGTAIGAIIGHALGTLLRGSSRLSDQGVTIGAGSLDDTRFSAYQEHEVRRWRWGSRRNVVQTADLPEDVAAQFQLIIDSIVDTVGEAALALGMLPDEIEAALASYRQAEVQISLMDLTAEEQQAELEAVFSSIFDGLAGHVVPFITQFQRVGEGLGETLVRVATSVQVVQESMRYLGLVIDETDPERFAQISVALVDMAGGVEEFVGQMLSFSDKFSPGSFRFAADTSALNSAFDEMGITLPALREGMWALMQSFDVTTESGREGITTLLSLADTADAYYKVLEKIEGEMIDLRREATGEEETVAERVRRQIKQIQELGASEEQLIEARRLGQQIIDRALEDFMGGIYAMIGSLDPTSYIRQFQDIDRQMHLNIRTATELGASEQQLSHIRRLAALQTARLIQELNTSIASLWKEFSGVTDVASQVSDISNSILEVERERYQLAQQAFESIGDYLKSLEVGEQSGGDWRSRMTASRGQFDELFAAAMGGDMDAANELVGAAEGLLTMGQDVFGDTRLFRDLRTYVIDALRQVQLLAGAVEDPGAGEIGSPGNPAVTEDTAANRYELALQIASQIGALGFARGKDVFALLDKFGIPLMSLVTGMGINLGKLTEEGLIDLSILAMALNVTVPELLAKLGVGIGQVAEVFGLSSAALLEGVTTGFAEFVEFLGIPVLEALELLGLNIQQLAPGFGVHIDNLTAETVPALVAMATALGIMPVDLIAGLGLEFDDLALAFGYIVRQEGLANFDRLKEMARLIGIDILALADLIGEDFNIVKDGIVDTLGAIFEDLPEDLPEGIRDQLTDLFEDLGTATNPAEMKKAIADLLAFTRDNLPGSLGESLAATLREMGLLPDEEPESDVMEYIRTASAQTAEKTDEMVKIFTGESTSVFTTMNAHLASMLEKMGAAPAAQAAAMEAVAGGGSEIVDAYMDHMAEAAAQTEGLLAKVREAQQQSDENIARMMEAVVTVGEAQVNEQQGSGKSLRKISKYTKRTSRTGGTTRKL